ncbi:phosphoribosylaminoimidazolesuccinocarboxamide synthase [bacterium]|nr:phosphoribosylaminoimidazolesuccinocarboxamide synthase [bacterium]
MGSVKDLIVIDPPKKNAGGRGRFCFSDRYSVFDWGEMPDLIPEKGKALCLISAYFFERLEELGIKTHYLGLIEDGKLKQTDELKTASNFMEVKLVRVLKPNVEDGRYDYSVYKAKKGNFLIPIEVIWRNLLGEGSSLIKRLKEGSTNLKDLGLSSMPKDGEVLSPPVIEASTKLESSDRYISWEEAKEICGLDEEERKGIKRLTEEVNKLITQEVEPVGLVNCDGKIEFGFTRDRHLLLVDAVGTLDECRFTYSGLSVSKELLRIFYRETDWFAEVEEVKKGGEINWKECVKSTPPPLPEKLLSLISALYQASCNEITKRKWFDVPPFSQIINEIQGYYDTQALANDK